MDTNFIFSSSSRCLVEHEKIKFVSTSGHVMFCLLYKHTNEDFFYDFPKISEHFPKISEEDPMMFRSHGNTSKFSLSYYVTMAMVIFSISSHTKDKNSIITARDEDMIF